jgi:hypothetical protein
MILVVLGAFKAQRTDVLAVEHPHQKSATKPGCRVRTENQLSDAIAMSSTIDLLEADASAVRGN